MRLIAMIILGMWVYAAVGPLTAQENSVLKRLGTADDSRGWEGVGRVDIADAGFCTGTLVEERLVLTAAHCLFERESGARIADERIEFRAGWRDGRAVAYRKARRSVVHPDYVYNGPRQIESAGHDMALIELDHPIRLASVPPFGTARAPRVGETVELVSYAMEREEAPSLQEKCHVLGEDRGLLMLSCDVNFGASGAPVFVASDSGVFVVSVVSAKAEWRGTKVSLAATLGERYSRLRQEFDAPAMQPREISPVSGVAARAGTGAKFVRP